MLLIVGYIFQRFLQRTSAKAIGLRQPTLVLEFFSNGVVDVRRVGGERYVVDRHRDGGQHVDGVCVYVVSDLVGRCLHFLGLEERLVVGVYLFAGGQRSGSGTSDAAKRDLCLAGQR